MRRLQDRTYVCEKGQVCYRMREGGPGHVQLHGKSLKEAGVYPTMVASLFAGAACYPNDTVRSQLQMGRYDTYAGAARGLVAAGGVRRLYAGLAPYLFRAGPGAAIQFATFGELKKLLDSS